MSDKYAAITAHRERVPVRMMCAALDVSERGFYDAVTRAPSAHALADERLRVHVRAVFAQRHCRDGAPRVHRDLTAGGQRVAKKRVARLMREERLVARRRRATVQTTDSMQAEPIAPNLLARRFALAEHPQPNRAWVGDMTYIPTRAGWRYLAVLIDLASRKVVGWHTDDSLATTLPLRALQHALQRRQPRAGLVQHTDRGSQYASHAYREMLHAHGVVQRMSRRGNCWDNAVAESFFATLEHALLDDADFHTHGEAHRALADFIDVWYNTERQHSTLGYVSPVQYERQLRQMARAA